LGYSLDKDIFFFFCLLDKDIRFLLFKKTKYHGWTLYFRNFNPTWILVFLNICRLFANQISIDPNIKNQKLIFQKNIVIIIIITNYNFEKTSENMSLE